MTENRFLLDLFPWAPRPLIVLALLAAAISVAVIVHLVLWSIFQRFFGARYPFLREIITRTRAISNFAFIMLAVSAAVPLAPLHAHVVDGINRVLLAAFIVFLGWLVIVGANLAMDRYIGRFKLDVIVNDPARLFPGMSPDQIKQRLLESVKTGTDDAVVSEVGEAAVFKPGSPVYASATALVKGRILQLNLDGVFAGEMKDQVVGLLKSAASRL